jgi:signal transduction histidine kinase
VTRLNRELTRLDGVKNELIERVAGRLEGPITSLVTTTGALAKLGAAPPEKTAKFVALIQDQVDELAKVGDSLAQASLMVADPEVPAVGTISLPDLLRRAVSPLRDAAKRHEVEIKVLAPSDLSSISGDADGLTTALRAVIKNAIEHSRSGDGVRVEVHRVSRAGEPWVELKVADVGSGIPEDDRDRVFDPFWQGTTSPGIEGRGLGLGLAIARRVVERHGGKISIAAGEPAGTEVSIVLPQRVASSIS